MRADIKLRVHGAGDLHDARTSIELRRRTLADFLDLASQSLRLAVAVDSAVDCGAQGFLEAIDLILRLGAQIHPRGRGLRNRIYRGPALEDADVIGRLLLAGAWDIGLVEIGHNFGQNRQRIGLAKIAPGVSAFAAQSDLEATAAER